MKNCLVFLFFLFSVMCYAGEACPEFISLKIHNGKVQGENFESAVTPHVRTSLEKNTLKVDIQRKFQGQGKIDFSIPENAKSIQLFGCEFELPPRDHTAYFHSVLLADIRRPWWQFSRDELQRFMLLIAFAPDKKSFQTQFWLYGKSKNDVWKYKKTVSCIIADDGQIFEEVTPEWQTAMGPGTKYFFFGFTNQNRKLQIRLRAAGKYYKYYKEKNFILQTVELPKPETKPYTLFFLNMPFKEKYLSEHQSGHFAVKKNVAEFRLFAEKLKRLRCGMTPEETAAILGAPDDFSTHAPKRRSKTVYGSARYLFLKVGESSLKNLTVTLSFEKDPSGKFRLKVIY